MKTIQSACELDPKALDINVGDQIEKLDEVISGTDGRQYFKKTFITEGMKVLLTKGMARLAGKSSDAVFHLKQAMGGGKTHLMVGFGLLAKDSELRKVLIGTMPYQGDFTAAKIAAFNGRNNPGNYFWGELSRQLDREALFKEYWESGAKAPDEQAWLSLFEGDNPVLILMDEMPPYFHYYATQSLGQGTVADVATRAFSNMLTAAQKKKNVCIVVSDLEAAYDTGGKLIQRALNDASQELGRAEISITPVNLESNEIYEILRKRLFLSLPDKSDISEIAAAFGAKLAEAAKAKTVERSAEAMAEEIESTYPFHPSFKSIVALFKENEKFKQTRGLMELVSRLLKSVWQSKDDVYLMGAQHFDLSIHEVREKLAEISSMRDVIAKDLWNSSDSAHAQVIDINAGNNYAKQAGTLLLTASLSTAVNSVKGLTEMEMLECLIDPLHQAGIYRAAFEELQKNAWYLHQTQEGRNYFDHQENLTKKLRGYADKAPQPKVDELIRHRLNEMYKPTTKEAYEKILPLPEMDDALASLKSVRTLLIIDPDGKTPPGVVTHFFKELVNKNNVLILTGDKSSMADVDKAARHFYAAQKADNEISATHPQRKELDEKKAHYEQDFQATILSVFDKLFFPGNKAGEDVLRHKALDLSCPSGEPYNGERQIIKTLTQDPIKLYTQVAENFDALKSRAESLLFGSQDEMRKTDLLDKMKQNTRMPWLPVKGFDLLAVEAFQRGVWEDLGNGYYTRAPKPKTTQVIISEEGSPDDEGKIRLKIDSVNAGQTPKIYYEEDGEVSESSPQLKDNILVTRALRVQFLAVDPTGKNQTGDPTTWTNRLVLRNKFNPASRTLELFVAPKGKIRYTLDGSEPRNGTDYADPIELVNEETTVYVFAECDGLDVKRNFTFAGADARDIPIKPDVPAVLHCPSSKRLENASKTYEGLKVAGEKNILFEQVMIQIGSAPKTAYLTLGEMKLDAQFIEKALAHLQSVMSAEAPVVFSFKKAHFSTGFDLEQFVKSMEMEIHPGEVEQ
ncbi:anti-phage-associated DUF499 domain-containing protein [Desulfobacter postgatei]|jgi:hypothetical protein|uniref:anti-phage-associated DUF499 domain-containing protein n=1 Tax=Desulfobacter postgatei TaxID=2293 RepID=UPI002A367DA5|nr:anti-phage-associated DUF499 domain-containing protein [Desulfobacter postgatei]MDX9963713.1 DUF499 domain-containing protein [Desulfobacter postgatei]